MKNWNLTFTTFVFILFIAPLTQAQDWANFERFKDKNAALEIPVQRVVFMGDSITEGWLQDSSSFFYTKPYINRGISGQTTPQMLVRFRADVIKLRPAAVVILAGINDIAGNTGPSTIEMISDNIKSMAELAETHGIKVIICSVLPAYDFPWKPGMEPAPKVIELNRQLKTYADAKGMIYCDYFTPMKDKRNGLKAEYTFDEVHCTQAGYDVMATIVQGAIDKALMQ